MACEEQHPDSPMGADESVIVIPPDPESPVLGGAVVVLRPVRNRDGSWPLDGQQRARIKKACDNMIDAEDELLYVVMADPSLQPIIDNIVDSIVKLTIRAYPKHPPS